MGDSKRDYLQNYFRVGLLLAIFILSVFSNIGNITNALSLEMSSKGIRKTNDLQTNTLDINSSNKGTVNLLNLYNSQELLPTDLAHETVLWENYSVLNSPKSPVNPSIVVDTNNIIHICWSNYDNGRTLYHMMRYENGTMSSKEILKNYSSGEEIGLDLAADNFGKVHLVYSWGTTYDNQKTYYRYWQAGFWSTDERVDFGKNHLGATAPAHHPQVVIDSTGKPHVLWSAEVFKYSYDLNDHPVCYQKRIAPNSWSTVLYAGAARPDAFSMIITETNVIHASFSIKVGGFYNAYHIVSYTKKNAADNYWFSTQELFSYTPPDYISDKVPRAPLIEVAGVIYLYSFILFEDFPMIIEMKNIGGLWEDPTIVTSDIIFGGRTDLAVASVNNSDIMLIYTYNHLNELERYVCGMMYKVFDSEQQQWVDSNLITEDYDLVYYPDLVVDNQYNFHVVWRDTYLETANALFYNFGSYDKDLDGLSNYDEINIYGTLPNDPDTDDDLMTDGEEIALGYDPFDPDEDVDLILDGWEVQYGFDPNNATDATIDFDIDLLTNLEEFTYNTNPILNDTDSDSLLDGVEILTYSTDPLNPDSDFDLLLDGEEIITYFTNPLNNDTEGDGMPDGYEVANSLDPLLDDSGDDPDVDILTNIEEYFYGTNPQNNDTDFDALDDYVELFTYFTNPLDSDTDSDLLSDHYEIFTNPLDTTYLTANIYQTDPLKPDTDFDSLSDYQEIAITLTNPLVNDTDSDLMSDGYEYYYGLDPFSDDANQDYDNDFLTNYEESLYNSDPFNADTDNDRLYDYEEAELGTSLTSSDTDGDQLTDYAEVIFYYTNPLLWDTDSDGLNDFYEVLVYRSNPFVPDTDKDGLIDGDEVFLYNSNPNFVDTDFDRLHDADEIAFNSEPYLFDTDSDGMDDFWEWQYSFDPRVDDSKGDPDGDVLTNLEEYKFFSHPFLNDTDGDLLNDFDEIYIYMTYPFAVDSDDDLLSDYEEIFSFFTLPTDPDCDDDSLLDGQEILEYLTDPKMYDTDLDDFSDSQEIVAGTNPLDPNSNPRMRTIILSTSIFGSIIFVILVYYTIPFFLKLSSGSYERDWIRAGMKRRAEKSQEMISKSQFENKN
ncbi:MAG: hypothetical protein ACFFDW_02635 [Candidatus Thorarchaeota archaeon]